MRNDFAERLKRRPLGFSLRVMRLCRTFQGTWEGAFVADQLFRASARTAANYRAACRARSHRDFTYKLGITVEEADESLFGLTFIGESGLDGSSEQRDLLAEASELLAISTKSAKTASANDGQKSHNKSAISNQHS